MTDSMRFSLMLVGCGKMGGAMLEGWIADGLDPKSICVIEPSPESAAQVSDRFNVHVVTGADALSEDCCTDCLVFAIKPQMMDDVVSAFRRFAEQGALVVSIAAGKSIAYFEQRLGQSAKIVRAMPNTPAAIGRGISVLCAGANVDEAGKERSSKLLSAVGQIAWVDDESLIDPVTALSGGGPAYVFLLVESLAKAGVEAGLPQNLAETLARATVAGSGALLDDSPEAPETLRKNVTSPGGTTARALRVLMGEDGGPGWQPLIDKAIIAASKRSQELAG